MTRFNTWIVAAVAALFVSGGAMAATLQPAAGEAPFANALAASTSPTLTRAAVEAQAAAHLPAAGQLSASQWVPDAAARTRTQAAHAAHPASTSPFSGNAPYAL